MLSLRGGAGQTAHGQDKGTECWCLAVRLMCEDAILEPHPHARQLTGQRLKRHLAACLNNLISSQDSHKGVQREKAESLDDDRRFVEDLARDLQRVCQVTAREGEQSSSGWEQSTNTVRQDPCPLFCLRRGQRSWITSGCRMTSGPSPFAGPSSGSGPLYWRAKRSAIFVDYSRFLHLLSQ